MKYLNDKGIQNKIYHIPLASDAPVFKKYRRFETPNARKSSKQVSKYTSS